jgi:hypothetical protein
MVALVVASVIPTISADAPPVANTEHPIAFRGRIIREHLMILRQVEADAKYLTGEQEKAMRVLGTFRSEKAATTIVKLIAVKRRTPAGTPFQEMRSRVVSRVEGDEYPAVAALVNIGATSLVAICQEMATHENNDVAAERVRLYKDVIQRLFPGEVGLRYVRELRNSAPAQTRQRYDALIKLLEDTKKPAIMVGGTAQLET